METKHNIGDKIRELRESKGILQNDLALRANLSVGQIKQIEEEKIFPSLTPLIKIARSLGVRIGAFLDTNKVIGPVVNVAGEEKTGANFINQHSENQTHLDFYALASNKAGRHMEPFIINIQPSTVSDYKLSSHEGEEFIYVLEGSVEINYGKEVYVINTGDSIYYDSVVTHNVHAANNQPAKILANIYVPL